MPYVEICGEVEDAQLSIAPLSGLPCVLYRVELTLTQRLLEAQGGGRRELCGVRFVVNSERGPVLVDPSSAALLWPGTKWRIALGRDRWSDQRMVRLYSRLGRKRPLRAIRCREWLIEPGSRLVVSGDLRCIQHSDGQAQGYREPPRLQVLSATTIVGA